MWGGGAHEAAGAAARVLRLQRRLAVEQPVGGAGPEISSMHCAAVRREQLLSGREGYGQKVWDLCRTRADPLCEEDFRAFR